MPVSDFCSWQTGENNKELIVPAHGGTRFTEEEMAWLFGKEVMPHQLTSDL